MVWDLNNIVIVSRYALHNAKYEINTRIDKTINRFTEITSLMILKNKNRNLELEKKYCLHT